MKIQSKIKSALSDGHEYLKELKVGDEKAFREIMGIWYARLYNFANGYLSNEENAKEIIQDVFLKLWDQREKLSEETVLKAYLFTLTRNRCIDMIRRERLMLQFLTDKKEEYQRLTENYEALSDPILDDLFVLEIQEEVDRVVGELPEQCQKVFILSRKNGLKNKEISELLKLSEKTVESHLTKALKTIRQVLERKFPGSLMLLMVLDRRIARLFN